MDQKTKRRLAIGAMAVGAGIVAVLCTHSKRDEVVSAALKEVGLGDGSKYWQEVLTSAPPYPPDWCGGFALWALKQAGLAKNIFWRIGLGFLYQLPITNTPAPGDIAYFNHFQHHALVESVDGSTVHLINGNGTGGVVSRSQIPMSQVTAFYSIEPLLKA